MDAFALCMEFSAYASIDERHSEHDVNGEILDSPNSCADGQNTNVNTQLHDVLYGHSPKAHRS